MRDPVEIYFTTLRDIRASGAGVAETSFYPALAELLTALGSKLKPKVTAIPWERRQFLASRVDYWTGWARDGGRGIIQTSDVE